MTVTYLSEVKEIGTTALGKIHLASLSTDRLLSFFHVNGVSKIPDVDFSVVKLFFISFLYKHVSTQSEIKFYRLNLELVDILCINLQVVDKLPSLFNSCSALKYLVMNCKCL